MLESPWQGRVRVVSCVDTLSQIFSTADRSLGFLAGKFSKIFARCARRQIFIQIFENLGLPQAVTGRGSVLYIYRSKSGIYHFLINLSSGMGEWYMKVVYNSFDS